MVVLRRVRLRRAVDLDQGPLHELLVGRLPGAAVAPSAAQVLQAVPLGRAISVVKARIGGDVVKARLCRQEQGLVYLLTVLAQNGKVTRARVDAADGQWLDGS